VCYISYLFESFVTMADTFSENAAEEKVDQPKNRYTNKRGANEVGTVYFNEAQFLWGFLRVLNRKQFFLMRCSLMFFDKNQGIIWDCFCMCSNNILSPFLWYAYEIVGYIPLLITLYSFGPGKSSIHFPKKSDPDIVYSRSTLLDSDVRVYFILRWDPSAFINNWKGSKIHSDVTVKQGWPKYKRTFYRISIGFTVSEKKIVSGWSGCPLVLAG